MKFKDLVVRQGDLGKGRMGIWHKITNICTGHMRREMGIVTRGWECRQGSGVLICLPGKCLSLCSTYLPSYLPVHLCLSVCQSIYHLFNYLSIQSTQSTIHPSSVCIYTSILFVYHLFSIFYLSTYLSFIYLSVIYLHLSIYLLIYSICLSNHSFILHIYLFRCPSYLFIIYLSICLSI